MKNLFLLTMSSLFLFFNAQATTKEEVKEKTSAAGESVSQYSKEQKDEFIKENEA